MIKLLLTAGLVAATAAAHAQQRLALYEEFSGENCGPCAAANPGLWTLLSANTSKVLLLKYQSPIPSAGPIYNAYTTVTNARLSYYSVPFAPYGRLDGTVQGIGQPSPGHVNYLTQSIIDAEAATAAPFNITVSHQWTTNGDSVRSIINLVAPAAYAPSGANLKLRVALIEHLQYPTAPGTNGETEFHNVVREMYPTAGGTQLANAWTAGQSQSITIKGRVPAYVDKSGSGTRVVVWVQDDATKVVAQAVASTFVAVPLDLASTALSVPSSLVCAAGSANVNSVVSLRNAGSATVTSAVIYYRLDAGVWQTYNWTGSLATQATASVNLPVLSVAPGAHTLTDSVARPNGVVDVNGGNNKASVGLNVRTTAGVALPIAADFENAGALPTNWLLYDANANAKNWTLAGAATTTTGHGSSHYMLYHNNFDFLSGEANYAVLPADNVTSGGKMLDFYVAYAQYASENDRLEVVYSTNCGTSWTSVWNMAGAALATAPATTARFVPTRSQWMGYTVDLSAIPANALIAFRATSNYGNSLYVDDVTLRSSVVSATTSAVAQSATLAPNPSNTQAVLSFNLTKGAAVYVTVTDALGRTVATPTNGTLNNGQQQVAINTADLAVGLYNVVVRTTEGTFSKRLTVIH